ncbi:tetratricopeptide repeat protein, partial [candidate division WOR-3 bacterium]|nr:tetratricopeptide repeat protein [candidate division WOR-3 bacterium]
FGRAGAGIAAFGFALCGILVFYSGALLYVELTVFLSLLAVWLVLVADRRWWRWTLAGAAFGLLVICRPEMLLLLPAFGVILWRQGRGLRNVMLLVIAALLVIATVPARNLIVARDPVLFTGHSGINFYYGNNPASDGTWQPAPELEATPGFSHARLEQVARRINGEQVPWSRASAHWLNKGVRYLVSHPGRALELAGRKFLLFWADYEVPSNYYPETARAGSLPLRLAFISFGIIAALAIPGLVLGWRDRKRNWPAYLFVAVHLVSALAFYVMSRLRAPVIPFLLLFAGLALATLFRDLRARRFGRPTWVLTVAALVFAGSLLVPVRKQEYSSQAWTQQGNILLSLRRANEAKAAFERAVAANPANPSARYSLLMVLAGMGRAGEAEQQYRELVRCCAADPRAEPIVRLAGARVAVARRDFGAALAGYRRAIELDPGNPESWYLLGLVYVSTDSLPQAAAALERALELDPGHSSAADILGRVRQRLGRP